MKRSFDFCWALVCLILFSPLFLVCYIAIRLEDGGPAFFRQERIGKGGKPFDILKFRSMTVDGNRDEYALFKHEKNENLTRIGRFLRDHHLDELPQLWNVVKGDMSFIGPRPERKYYIDLIMEKDPRYERLYQLRPGVTSYATSLLSGAPVADARCQDPGTDLSLHRLRQEILSLLFSKLQLQGG